MSEPTPQADIGSDRWADPTVAYDAVAARYAGRFLHELDTKPFDQDLLTRFATVLTANRRAHGTGVICDLGCGPGHVGAFLAERGARVVGIDHSRGMVTQARLHYPTMPVGQGDMAALGLLDGSLAGIVCFYALIHIPRAQVPDVLHELHRVLTVGGALLVAVHGGEGLLARHADAGATSQPRRHALLILRIDGVAGGRRIRHRRGARARSLRSRGIDQTPLPLGEPTRVRSSGLASAKLTPMFRRATTRRTRWRIGPTT